MFDDEPPKASKRKPRDGKALNTFEGDDRSLDEAARRSTEDVFRLNLLTTEELLRLHAQVVVRLPPTELSKMDLEKELLLQYHSVCALQAAINEDPAGIPFNQRAQVANTVSSVLKSLIDLQDVVYPQERFKAVESVLIRVLCKLPEKAAAMFIKEYEEVMVKYA